MSWVDYARGIAIVLVLYRHIVVGLGFSNIKIPQLVYDVQEYSFNFRMPVFFILSGCFLFLSLKKYSEHKVFIRKVNSLLYPYVLWTVILITFQIAFSDHTNASRTVKDYLYIILQPRELDHMWYLLALFNTSALFILLWRFLGEHPVSHLCLAVVLHFASFLLKDVSLLSDPFYHYIFLLVGTYIPKYLIRLEEKGNPFFIKVLLITIPFFICGQYFWMEQRDKPVLLAIPFVIVIFVAFLFFYCVCRILQNAGTADWLRVIGKNSLYIYILHLYVIASLRVFFIKVLDIRTVAILLPLSLVLGILIPILAYRLANRFNMWYLFSLNKPINSKTGYGS